jgi:heme oxygenase (biliverdin-IX-beta and delta-forming)
LSISDRLKTFTTLSHQKLEKSIVGLIHDLQTSPDYSYLLGLFYSYFGGMERLIVRQDIKKYLPDYDERRKAKLILEDLLALHISSPDFCQKDTLPVIDSPFRALGALYVMEGSTLGGVYIVKMIQKKLSAKENIFHFFSGYGDRNPLMWNRFKNALDHSTADAEEMALILSGAEDSFHKFYEWINMNQNANR